MEDMKKIILMILPVFLLAGCTVKEKEMEITVFRNVVSSVYTGEVKKKLPEGEGEAVLENDARVEGLFEQGALISGAASKVPYSTSLGEIQFDGIYSGDVSEQLPSGNGEFSSDDFTYKGTWISGQPTGQGTVSSERFIINTPEDVLEGSYIGDMNQGLAEGKGTFTYQSEEDEIRMEGSFAGGQFDGLLVKTITHNDRVRSYPVYYQNGAAVDSAASKIAYLQSMRNDPYCLSEAQWSCISDHSALFEGKGTEKDAEKFNSVSFDYKAFSETDEPAIMVIRNADVLSVQRYQPYPGSDPVTSMIVQNEDGHYHLIFAYSEEDADKGDKVDICALPLCRSTLTAPEQDYKAIDAAGAMVIKPQS